MKHSRLPLVIIIACFTSCTSNRFIHLDAQTFQQEAQLIEQPNSVMDTQYIGSSKNRAYLEKTNLITLSSKPTTTVFWTELNGLPENIKTQLKADKSPWKHWDQLSTRQKNSSIDQRTSTR